MEKVIDLSESCSLRKNKTFTKWLNDLLKFGNKFLATDSVSSLPAGIQKLQVSTAAHLKQQELLKQVSEQQFVPKEPPPEFEFIADPPSISALDLYVFCTLR